VDRFSNDLRFSFNQFNYTRGNDKKRGQEDLRKRDVNLRNKKREKNTSPVPDTSSPKTVP